MRLTAGLCVTVFAFAVLTGCSTYRSMFPADEPAHDAMTTQADPAPGNERCARVAAQRADDAVTAEYVSEDSPGKRDIYQATYRDCAERSGH